MNKAEFYVWLDHHKSAYPGLRNWLGKQGAKGSQDTLLFWQKVLEPVELEDAKDATFRLAENSESQPKSYERHPVEVKRLCKRSLALASRQVGPSFDGAVKCLRCRDAGIVTVFYWRCQDVDEQGVVIRTRNIFDRMAIAERVLAVGHEKELRTACCRCDCNAGERFLNHPVWRDFCLTAEGSASWRTEQRFWESVGDNRPTMAGASSTRSAADLATADWSAF